MIPTKAVGYLSKFICVNWFNTEKNIDKSMSRLGTWLTNLKLQKTIFNNYKYILFLYFCLIKNILCISQNFMYFGKVYWNLFMI